MTFDWKVPLPLAEFSQRMPFSIQIFIFRNCPTLVQYQDFLKIYPAKISYREGSVKRNINCCELSNELNLLWVPHVMKHSFLSWLNKHVQKEFLTPWWSFGTSLVMRWKLCQIWISCSQVIRRSNRDHYMMVSLVSKMIPIYNGLN